MLRKIRGFILIVLVIFVAYAAYADTITLSTFYPSPYGSYQNLDTTSTTYLATSGAAGTGVGIGVASGTSLLGRLHVGGSGYFTGNLESTNAVLTSDTPLTIGAGASNTIIANLNADKLDGLHAADILDPITTLSNTKVGASGNPAGTNTLFAWMQKLYDKPSGCYVDYSGICSVSGFTSKANLGRWGACYNPNPGYGANSASFRPPGVSNCFGGYDISNFGPDAILCCATSS